MARVLPTTRWLRVESARARKWLRVESTRKKRRLLVEIARAKVVWPDIKRTQEFRVALLLFVVFAVAVGVLWLASTF